MKKVLSAGCIALFLAATGVATGCAYSGVAATDAQTVVIAKNDAFLFGLLRKVYVCQVTPEGLANCSVGQNP